jgi:DMSO reductase anchor subunit
MTKCTFCHTRLQDGQPPACVELCPTGALDYADLEEEKIDQTIAGFPRTTARPRVKITPLSREEQPPELTSPAPTHGFDARDDLPDNPISWQTEWALVGFTFLAALLVAAWAVAGLGRMNLDPVAFAAPAGISLGLSAVHLGRRWRAPRAVVNLAQSWLSREVLLVVLFYGLATVTLIWPGGISLNEGSSQVRQQSFALWAITGLGFLSLVTIDQVYRQVQRTDLPGLHSAHTLLTGLFLTGILGAQPGLATAVGLVKLTLYLARKVSLARKGEDWRPLWSVIRCGLGFALPGLGLMLGADLQAGPIAEGVITMSLGPVLLGSSVILAELIDRCEFYDELVMPTPARQLALHLKRLVSEIE